MRGVDVNVCVVGLGYIGLPTAALLATKGFTVHGVDICDEVVDTINRGDIHIHEPDLDILVKSAVHSGRLSASTEAKSADVFILAVPTPFSDGYVPDMTYVEAAIEAIAEHVRSGNLIILESTSPVGTTEKMAEWLAESRLDLAVPRRGADDDGEGGVNCSRVNIAHCPERVLPGHILKELVDNDRIVGGIDNASTTAATTFYGSFVAGTILETDSRTAELAKLTENAFRDVNIAFANELSIVADRLDVNVWDLVELANHHPRVNILRPGPGVGGHCIAVDPWFIIHAAGEHAQLMRTARIVNDSKPDYVISKVRDQVEYFNNPKVVCLGLAFKANIDDLRESPSVKIVERLAESKIGEIITVEPHVEELPRQLSEAGVHLVDMSTALAIADIVVVLVDHDVFKELDPKSIGEKVVIDTRGIWR